MCPISVLRAYGLESLKFGAGIHHPQAARSARHAVGSRRQSPRRPWRPAWPARQIDIDEYREQLAFRQGKGEQVRYFIMNKAAGSKPKKRIVFAEGEEAQDHPRRRPGAG